MASGTKRRKLDAQDVRHTAVDGESSSATKGGSGLLETMENNLNDIRDLINCRICCHSMYEPYTTECGHTFCYGCLVKWFEQNRVKKSCPDCRAPVSKQPAPSYTLRDISHIFSARAELLPAGETTEEHKVWQEEERQKVESDRSSHHGLFPGIFGRHSPRAVIQDPHDGVVRCPRCTWELEDGMCGSCGWSDSSDTATTLSEASDASYYFNEDPARIYRHGVGNPDLYLDGAGAFLDEVPEFQGQDAQFYDQDIHDDIGSISRFDSTLEDESDGDGSIGSLAQFIVDEETHAAPSEHAGSDYRSPHAAYADSISDLPSDDPQSTGSEDDHRSREETVSAVGGRVSPHSAQVIELDSDSEPIPIPRRRRMNDAASSRRLNANNPRQHRPLAMPSHLNYVPNVSTVSVDSDSEDLPNRFLRPQRRPRTRLRVLSDDDDSPSLPPSTEDRIGDREDIPSMINRRCHRIAPGSNRGTPHLNRNAPVLVDSPSPKGQSNISIPGAYPNSFSQSEPSQTVARIASPAASETSSHHHNCAMPAPNEPALHQSPNWRYNPYAPRASNPAARLDNRHDPRATSALLPFTTTSDGVPPVRSHGTRWPEARSHQQSRAARSPARRLTDATALHRPDGESSRHTNRDDRKRPKRERRQQQQQRQREEAGLHGGPSPSVRLGNTSRGTPMVVL